MLAYGAESDRDLGNPCVSVLNILYRTQYTSIWMFNSIDHLMISVANGLFCCLYVFQVLLYVFLGFEWDILT